ncbi:hypothetical protein HELRODRAFT_190161 [Helobdella robusta]|uniref:Uncharacterized protein n=1 Tax=Helobdella robusta TaxID=6412 RepID=T1FRR2_HELRO|nr:hypothetical protein HELRODRAFT_190161 [Helobdella robusta]ESO10753.1 hypothetical protein HELRODRAFT_190161 [Helobdella robusta]
MHFYIITYLSNLNTSKLNENDNEFCDDDGDHIDDYDNECDAEGDEDDEDENVDKDKGDISNVLKFISIFLLISTNYFLFYFFCNKIIV